MPNWFLGEKTQFSELLQKKFFVFSSGNKKIKNKIGFSLCHKIRPTSIFNWRVLTLGVSCVWAWRRRRRLWCCHRSHRRRWRSLAWDLGLLMRMKHLQQRKSLKSLILQVQWQTWCCSWECLAPRRPQKNPDDRSASGVAQGSWTGWAQTRSTSRRRCELKKTGKKILDIFLEIKFWFKIVVILY